MLKNKKFKQLAEYYINEYSLNLENYNVLVPTLDQELLLPAIIAGMAGANNIYIFNPDVSINRDYEPESKEFNFKFKIVGSVSQELMPCLNIVLKDSKVPLKYFKSSQGKKNNFVTSIIPENLDFSRIPGINSDEEKKPDVPVIGLDFQNPKLGFYQRFSHIMMKKCYELGLDIFKSKILLAGSGDMLNCALGLFKSAGAVIYTYNTDSNADQSYISKHLKELDAVIIIDYPSTGHQVIGSEGLISISDIVDICPQIKIIHMSGNVEINSVILGNINHYPENITPDALNLSMNDLGERGITEIVVASLKAAENFLNKSTKKSLTLDNSVVTYKLLNNKSSLLLGEKLMRF